MLSMGVISLNIVTHLDVVVLLLYLHHPHIPLDHCSLFGLDHLVHHLLHDYLNQDLMRVE
jgi:hypothetical protein